MARIEEITIENLCTDFIFSGNVVLKSVIYNITKAVYKAERTTFIFEYDEKLPYKHYHVKGYHNLEDIEGRYLNSIEARKGRLVHYYYTVKKDD
jgi:hypothetical protein